MSIINYIKKLSLKKIRKAPHKVFDLTPPLPLPDNVTEQDLFDFITSIKVQDAPEAEMRAYGTHDFRRFVYTWGMARDVRGKCLELGANPYFTTMLLKHYTGLELFWQIILAILTMGSTIKMLITKK